MAKVSIRISIVLMAAMTFTSAGYAAAQSGGANPPSQLPTPVGYLSSPVAAVYALPPLPPAETLDIERNQVLSAQMSADRYARDEAFADAEAYLPDDLMTRFSVAAGETLTRSRRPILSHMLYRIWLNLDSFSSDLKQLHPRKRPFVDDPAIAPCDLSFLQDKMTGEWTPSYPSGHAADGYVAALLLADVMHSGAPGVLDRTEALMARGVRFGTNRVVCGVHYLSDVAAGEAFGKALYAAIKKTVPQFETDLICAREEEAFDRKGLLGKKVIYSPGCSGKSDDYAVEKH